MKEEKSFNFQAVINELVKSTHGALNEFVELGLYAVKNDPMFLSHLIAWNLLHGEIRDSKIALPIIALRGFEKDDTEYAENAIATLMSQDPKSVVTAYRFNKELSKKNMIISGGHRKLLQEALKEYLNVRQGNKRWLDKCMVQHRHTMKELFAVSHVRPTEYAHQILFEKKYPEGSIFDQIAKLKKMNPTDAAGTILKYDIPFQIARGALGIKKEEMQKNPEFLISLMEGMSGQQLIKETKFLKSVGVFDSRILLAQYDKTMEKAKKDKRVSTLKASKAMNVLDEEGIDPDIIAKLSDLQESKISEKKIDGDWVVLADKSGSMKSAIELGKEIASYITKSVSDNVYLIFFDSRPLIFDVTGKTLQEIQKQCKDVRASGATSCGCGLKYLMDRNIIVNGIAIASDGGDNTYPYFHQAYKEYITKMQIEPTIYFYRVRGDSDILSVYCKRENIPVEYFQMNKADYYSLPNLVSSMKTVRYTLIDEIMNTPLLTLKDVFKK